MDSYDVDCETEATTTHQESKENKVLKHTLKVKFSTVCAKCSLAELILAGLILWGIIP